MPDIVVISPYEQKILGTIKADEARDVHEKIQRAKLAQREWAALSIKERAQVMFSYRGLLRTHHEELCRLIHDENGKTINEASAEVDKAIEAVEFACSLPSLVVEEQMLVSRGVHCSVTHRALGVVASITPFNFPLMIPNWTAPIALTLGNAMVLKPSPLVPLSAKRMSELLTAAGIPRDLFCVVNGGEDAVNELVHHADISAISFVGSTPIAKKVYQAASFALKRALCLGGAKNFLIVLPDAEPALTAENIVASAFGMAGQRCMAATILIALNNSLHIIDGVVNHAMKLNIGKDIPPIITHEKKLYVEKMIDEAQEQGAKVLLDGRRIKVNGSYQHNFIGPTILSEVSPSMTIANVEVFGPVLSVITVNSVDEAIALQNDCAYGNGASVYTQNVALANYFKERLYAGMIGINIGIPVPREPFSFGGIKCSKFGHGDISGKSAIAFWTNLVKCTTKWKKEDATNWMC